MQGQALGTWIRITSSRTRLAVGSGRQNEKTPVSTANRGLLWGTRRAASISPPFQMGLIGQMVTVPRAQCCGGGAFFNAFVKVLLIRAGQSTRGFRVVKRRNQHPLID